MVYVNNLGLIQIIKEKGMPYFYVIIIVTCLDQLSKWLVQTKLDPFQSIDYFYGWVSLTYARNSGGAFSIFPTQTVLLSVVAVVISVLVWLNRRQISNYTRIFQVGVAIAMGGTLGNLLDRIRLGYVVDFIDFHYWPVFNIADIAIVVGVSLIILGLLLRDATG
jgi:signal peptidase II